MRRTFKTRVRDKAGTLNRLTSIFVRRQFNIVNITASPTTEDGITEITFVAEIPDEHVLRNLILQVKKQINILTIEDITDNNTYNRELLLLKLQTPEDRETFEQALSPYNQAVTILKETDGQLYLQAVGAQKLLDALLDVLAPYQINEYSRTGSAAVH
ncbi:hypothetical protein JCM2421_15700 [Staphylococcus auricularis]|uniref:Acetolactate synthase small subunit n=1 Tax=Staphylococcus auricularis TaxID=29379 RepID=A0AAP8PQ08_9STAP|nr:acetolactate synthase small subunit [Staphylococcus auricularis]MDC6328024.1 acetolactate synthase small subunit [Staphylococcus auricularis]MDN4532124.1 acetolactate synthase small subunit [Staphylococcus auricularis]PNZ68736.1 acetolactate synthase small subunit [Staphylococcus auricularis]QPT06757.1 acetolactate synthase small subunit [Staphylococcus auricularis]SQJ14228.1 acetolactate synthase small subunit [Staphylococcus auricularis]